MFTAVNTLNSLYFCWNDVQLTKQETKTALQRDKNKTKEHILLLARRNKLYMTKWLWRGIGLMLWNV